MTKKQIVRHDLDFDGVSKIKNLPTPTDPSDPATKEFAEGLAIGITPTSEDKFKVVTVKDDETGYEYQLPLRTFFTSEERDAISPPTNLVIYNSTVSSLQKFNGATWDNIGGSGGGSSSFADLTGSPADNAALAAALAGKEPTIPTGDETTYIRGDKTLATLNKSAVGLSNADNTSDANKPISTATQTALDGKENALPTGGSDTFLDSNKTFSKPSFSKLSDVSVAGITNGQSIKYNSATGKFETYDIDKVNSIGDGVTYFLNDTSSPISGYKTLAESFASSGANGTIETASVTSAARVLIKSFASSAIGKTSIKGGIFGFTFGAAVDTTAGLTYITAELYKRTTGGTETLIFSTDSPTIDAIYDSQNPVSSFGIASVDYAADDITLNADDVLVAKFFANTTHNGSVNVYLLHSQALVPSHFHTPITKSHNQLDGLNDGDYQHLSAEQKAAATREADSSQSGLLSSSNWIAFNNKIGEVKTINDQSLVGSGNIEITGGGGNMSVVEVTGTTQTIAANTSYMANNAARIDFTLPSTASVGDVFEINGLGNGGWKINQNAGQSIRFGSSVTTSGTGGSVSSESQYDSILVRCIVADTAFRVVSGVTKQFTIV